jgi:hypothetical protein
VHRWPGFQHHDQIAGGAAGTFKVVADASLKAAYKRTKQEDTPVALQIVHDCLEIAKQASVSGSDRGVAQSYEKEVNQSLKKWQQQQVDETPHIKLSRDHAGIGGTVTVRGTGFWPKETVDIHVAATLVKQVEVDTNGSFKSTIVIPSSAPPPDFGTSIPVSGESSAKSAQSPFHTS